MIGRIEDQRLVLDLRCLEDETAFVTNLATLAHLLSEEGAVDLAADQVAPMQDMLSRMPIEGEIAASRPG